MTPWTLLRTSDAAVILAGASVLLGFVSGLLMMLCLFWRRLTRDQDGEIRRLRDTVDDQVAVLSGLYQQNDKLAKMIVLQHAVDTTRRQGVGA